MVLRRAASAEKHFTTWSEHDTMAYAKPYIMDDRGENVDVDKKYKIDQYSSSKEHVCPDRHGYLASGRSWKTDSLSPYRPNAYSEPWSSHTASMMRVLIHTRAHT